MSRRPISHSDDLRRLEAEGYSVRIHGGKLVVRDIPFVDNEGAVHHDGTLVMPLTLAGDVAQAPDDHTASFGGGIPCKSTGAPLNTVVNTTNGGDLGDGIVVDCTCSMKPETNGGKYPDFYEKVTKYVAAITGEARVLDTDITATPFRPVQPDEDDDTPFKYLDTASSRAGIDALNERLAKERVAIVGLGGTGEYILDFVAKTRVAEIHAYDADVFLTHNAFRAPGAPTLDELNAAPLKVEHFTDLYGNMRTGIVAHAYLLDESNVDELSVMTFVFVAIDDAAAKEPIVTALLKFGIPFIDVGMGVDLVGEQLTGVVRTTKVTPEDLSMVDRIMFTDTTVEGDYRTNIQIAELNARNAADAVIGWKKYRSIYADLGGEHHTLLSIATNHVVNEPGETEEKDS